MIDPKDSHSNNPNSRFGRGSRADTLILLTFSLSVPLVGKLICDIIHLDDQSHRRSWGFDSRRLMGYLHPKNTAMPTTVHDHFSMSMP